MAQIKLCARALPTARGLVTKEVTGSHPPVSPPSESPVQPWRLVAHLTHTPPAPQLLTKPPWEQLPRLSPSDIPGVGSCPQWEAASPSLSPAPDPPNVHANHPLRAPGPTHMQKNHSESVKPRSRESALDLVVAAALGVTGDLETALSGLSLELMAQQQVQNPALLMGTASGQ